jgi:hypothetical protein
MYSQWSTSPLVNNAICTASGIQANPHLVSDGSGGAIITWEDHRSGNTDIYAQRVNALGVVQWTSDGVAICTATGGQLSPQLASDGSGGAIITWYDYRGTSSDIYAQRVNASGAVQWTSNGVAICMATGIQQFPQLVSDGSGGAIITWMDNRSASNFDIYAQRVNASGTVLWTTDGVAICTATGHQYYPQLVSDGSGGAIITWYDYRGTSSDIYAQRVNASGAVQWTSNGVAICTAPGIQWYPQVLSDGSGGAIITWIDYRGTSSDIYAQRVNASGAVQWTSDGVTICTATGSQQNPQLVSDGSGGAIITWEDYRGTSGDIYAQRVNTSGTVQWTSNGVAICTGMGMQQESNPQLVSDGAEGAIIVWHASGNYPDDIYSQAIDASGHLGYPPNIVDVRDVPNDQGGHVEVLWDHSCLDALPNPLITGYEVYRGVTATDAKAGHAVLQGKEYAKLKSVKAVDKTYMTNGATTAFGDSIRWECINDAIAATKLGQYHAIVPTVSDSGPQGNPIFYYMVRAYYNSDIFWDSQPDSGYSVDNLSPVTPSGSNLSLVAGNAVKVSWHPDQSDPDVGHYAVYRSSTTGFTPSPATLLGTTVDTLYLDSGGSAGVAYYYRVATVDIHGNQSVPTSELSLSFAESLPAGWNLIGLPGSCPDAYYRTLYPTATQGTLFGYSGSYVATDTLHLGAGYWLKFPSPTVATIMSMPVQSNTVALAAGWSMITGLSCSVPISTIVDPGGIIVAGTVYAFNGAYVSSTTLDRGQGYWIKTRSAGVVSMTCGSTPKEGGEKNVMLADLDNAPSLTVGDASGAQQTLYWDVKLKDASVKESYSLPPPPPGGRFDARFAGDYRLTEASEALINIQTEKYPVTITGMNVPAGNDVRFALVEMVGITEGASHALTNGVMVEIQNGNVKSVMIRKEAAVPTEFSLQQNYPNPFNPTTTIRYGLPYKSAVQLTVYNTLGQEVAILQNEEQEAGYHEVKFDASGLSSGVYYCRMQAGSFVQAKKVLLLK